MPLDRRRRDPHPRRYPDAAPGGCDKVSINSAAVRDPEFVGRPHCEFGSQCIVVNIDPKRVQRDGREIWEVHINGGRIPTGLEAVAWAKRGRAAWAPGKSC